MAISEKSTIQLIEQGTNIGGSLLLSQVDHHEHMLQGIGSDFEACEYIPLEGLKLFEGNLNVVKITLRNGLYIIVDNKQAFPVFTKDIFRFPQIQSIIPADNLKVGDQLLCPRKYWGSNHNTDIELAKFLGVMICEGNWYIYQEKNAIRGEATLRIVQFEEDFKREISRLLEIVIRDYSFPANFYWDEKKEKGDVHGSYFVKFKALRRGHAHLQDIFNWMEDHIKDILYADSKFLNSEMTCWALFAGIMESDGFINNSEMALGINVSEIYRKDLYIQLFAKLGLAVRLDIKPAFVSKSGIKHNIMYAFTFHRIETIHRIYNNFKFVAEYKQIQFDRVIKLRTNINSTSHLVNNNMKVPITSIEKINFTNDTFYDIITPHATPVLVNGIYVMGVMNEDCKGLGQG